MNLSAIHMLHYKTIENSQFDRWGVMIHGAGGSIEVWFRQVADYARHFNLLLVDLAGHGGSANETFGRGFNFSRAAPVMYAIPSPTTRYLYTPSSGSTERMVPSKYFIISVGLVHGKCKKKVRYRFTSIGPLHKN